MGIHGLELQVYNTWFYFCFKASIGNHLLIIFALFLVTGDANFSMENTCLTVGGFSQPSVARSLIEQSTSAEVGLTQRFLWIFPKPTYSRFCTLEEVNKHFTENIGEAGVNNILCMHIL